MQAAGAAEEHQTLVGRLGKSMSAHLPQHAAWRMPWTTRWSDSTDTHLSEYRILQDEQRGAPIRCGSCLR